MNPKTRYRKFGKYLEEKFGTKVYKITIDAAFSCPNRDGTISNKGCIFCDDSGSFSKCHSGEFSIKKQVEQAIHNLPFRYHAKAYIAYFQAYTNTYGTCEYLKKIYDEAFIDDRIVGITIGTRPDCVDEEKINLISSYPNPWIEFGVQSANDKTLKLINRGHDFQCFVDAYNLCKKHNLKVCAHVILGLPEESKNDMLNTAYELAKLKVDGVKFHMLTVMKKSPLNKMYELGKVSLLSMEEYCSILCDFLEILPPETVIQRTAGTGLMRELVAPLWVKDKFETQNMIDKILEERNSYQGINYHE